VDSKTKEPASRIIAKRLKDLLSESSSVSYKASVSTTDTRKIPSAYIEAVEVIRDLELGIMAHAALMKWQRDGVWIVPADDIFKDIARARELAMPK